MFSHKNRLPNLNFCERMFESHFTAFYDLRKHTLVSSYETKGGVKNICWGAGGFTIFARTNLRHPPSKVVKNLRPPLRKL